MKYWNFTKAALYILTGFIIIFAQNFIMPYAGYVVGGVVIAYATEEIIISALKKDVFGEGNSIVEDIVQVVIGILLIISAEDIIKVCLIWGIWSVIRESREMTEAVKRVLNKRSGLISIIESVIVIVMSAVMVAEPTEGRANTHMILLGIELILEIVFPAIDYLFDKRAERKESTQTEEETQDIAA